MLTPVEKVDLFLRFATIGQIVLLVVLLLVRRPLTTRAVLAILIAPCVAAYLILTAPAGYAELGNRGLIMALVHSLPFLAWMLISDILNARPGIFARPKTLAIAIGVVVMVNVAIFWVADSPEVLHQVNHWLSIALLIHLLILTVHGGPDDLLPARRRMRAWIIGVFAGQFLMVVAVEITGLGLGNPQNYKRDKRVDHLSGGGCSRRLLGRALHTGPARQRRICRRRNSGINANLDR